MSVLKRGAPPIAGTAAAASSTNPALPPPRPGMDIHARAEAMYRAEHHLQFPCFSFRRGGCRADSASRAAFAVFGAIFFEPCGKKKRRAPLRAAPRRRLYIYTPLTCVGVLEDALRGFRAIQKSMCGMVREVDLRANQWGCQRHDSRAFDRDRASLVCSDVADHFDDSPFSATDVRANLPICRSARVN